MDNIEFETDKIGMTTSYIRPPKQSGMVKLLMNLGVTSESVANYILIGWALALFVFAFYLYLATFSNPKIDLTAEERAILLMERGATQQ